ncbi:DUF6643 family protein [Streptomyces sp. NRRL S-87]|uniref:DUF6643 family protein n=1 Tax=Streptomyces sp. NRRL S-87 TaxID=1463920 RepID=UPI0004BE9AFF|nr:DUF6643 family protein [Streptomyces sp. NRRL S-87]
MTSPRASYGGGYYSAPSFTDTPIYDSLVAERGTPQIAPIRVPAMYEPMSSGYPTSAPVSNLPALPAALPALPAAPVPAYQGAAANATGGYGYPYQQPAPQPVPLQQAPAPYIPQQQPAPRGYAPQQPPRPVATTGYEAMRPAAPRPMTPAPAAPGGYEDPYGRPYQGRGY